MSKKQGLRIISSQRAFQEAGHQDAIERAHRTLGNQRLGHDAFNNLIDAWEAKANISTLQLWRDGNLPGPEKRNVKLNDRSARISLAYMDSIDPKHPSWLSPTVYYGTATPYFMLAFERRLPLVIASEHVGTKISLQKGEVPTFTEAPFLYLSGLSILYSEVLGEMLIKDGKPKGPAFMALPSGLLHGDATLVPPNSFNHSGYIDVRADDIAKIHTDNLAKKRRIRLTPQQIAEKTLSLKFKIEDARKAPKYQPPAKIDIQTFVGVNEGMTKAQASVHGSLLELMEDPDVQKTVRFAMETYAMGSSRRAESLLACMGKSPIKVSNGLKVYDRIKGDLESIARTYAWKKLSEERAHLVRPVRRDHSFG